MPSLAIHVIGEFHGLVEVVANIDTSFTGDTAKRNAITSTQFYIVFSLGPVEDVRVTGGVGASDTDIVRGDPSTGNAQFNNHAILDARHPAAIEACTCTPVAFVDGAVVGFTHIEAVILHGSSEASTKLALTKEAAHTNANREILEVVLVVLDIEQAKAKGSSKAQGKAGGVKSSHRVGSSLLGSFFFGGDRISNSLLASSFFGSGNRIGASLFGSNRVGNSLLTSLFGSDRVGNGLLTGGFHSGSATIGVNILTKSINSTGVHSRNFGYRFGSGCRGSFGYRSSGSGGRLSRGSRLGSRCWLSSGCRSRCWSRLHSGCRRRSRCRGGLGCRCLSEGTSNH